MLKKTNSLGLILLSMSPVTLAAQEYVETVVVTASRFDKQRQQYPESLTAIDGHVLQLLEHNHIQQALARVPGANLARGNGLEYLPALRSPVLSGAGACGSVLAMEDGIPLRANGFCNINELFESHSEVARRVEVIRGPAGSLYGSNAMHGVVNILSPSIGENPKGFSGALEIEAGPHDYYRTSVSTEVDFSAKEGVRADLSLASDGGYRNQSGYDQQKLSLQHLAAKGNTQVRTHLAVINLNQETAGYVEGRNAYRDWQLGRENPNPEAFRDASAIRLYSKLDLDLGEDRQLLLTPYLRKTDMRFLQHYLPGQSLEENGQESVGLRSSYLFAKGEDLEVIVGLDTEFTQGYLRETQKNPTEGSDFLRATIPTGKHYDYQVDAYSVAPFTLATWNITDILKLYGGVRFESVQYDYNNKMLSGRTAEDATPCGFGGCRFSRPEDRKDSFQNWSPKLGVTYQLTSDLQLFTNLALGYRVPQVTELYRLQREQKVAELDSERISSVELGVRGLKEQLSYELVAYAMRKSNVIFRDTEYFNQSNGKTSHRGVELALSYAVTQNWRVEASSSYAEHRYRDQRELQGVPLNGNLVDSAPRVFGSYRLQWQPRQEFMLELEGLHQGRYYTDPQNQHEYSGHNLLNLRARWELDHWALSARVLNLTNEAYAERGDYSSFSGDRYFPGEPRSMYFSVSTDW
ncbi:TonB-dependent receptor [Microbulbifer sp. OS29]|uniref:TonB-dependent receptor n=1 Tax=Microbulbifer okhotskensis TaxID=2926617 RepID=A0A9X2EJW7_9GAMM|nr:TonB-dependent receptor [Microbulbifer okhotskensis]MCO1333587.1 TonB-dependent receptor [Microbulbifer okhotskensis]